MEIKITKKFGLGELVNRLQKVKLKGFPEVKIYGQAKISIVKFSPDQVKKQIFITQPSVYRADFLDRLEKLSQIFQKEGIDIFRLEGGVDYEATDLEGLTTKWTLISPVVEVTPFHFDNGLNYSRIIGPEVLNKGYQLNPQLQELKFPEYQRIKSDQVLIVCDGSHRLHLALEKNLDQHLVIINSPQPGFPYYAAPQPYSTVHVESVRPEGGMNDKTYILKEPDHKSLYRDFPSGEIWSGGIRPESN